MDATFLLSIITITAVVVIIWAGFAALAGIALGHMIRIAQTIEEDDPYGNDD